MNGACNRILNDFDRIQESVNQLLFVWGDSSFELKNGSAGKDELNKYYLDIILLLALVIENLSVNLI